LHVPGAEGILGSLLQIAAYRHEAFKVRLQKIVDTRMSRAFGGCLKATRLAMGSRNQWKDKQ
jgi:hypothetical protein